MISIFINIAALTFFALCHEKFVEVNDEADVALVGEQVTDHSLCPLALPLDVVISDENHCQGLNSEGILQYFNKKRKKPAF